MNVEHVMTRDVRTCLSSDTLSRAAQIMWENDCGFLPVVDDQRRVVSVVTDRDITMGAYLQGVPLGAASVSSVMSKTLRTCSPADDVADAERKMREDHVRRLPVVDDGGRLLGVVTIGDLARCSQSSAFQKAIGGVGVAKTLAAICEPRTPGAVAAAE